MSLFSDNEFQTAQERLQPYEFSTIQKGNSETLSDELSEKHGYNKVAMLVDGPKARSKSWDILMNKARDYFPDLLFLCIDAVQEHVPYWTQDGEQYDPKRSINIERLKTIYFYQKEFQCKGFKLAIQSNQFCRKYHYLNEDLYHPKQSVHEDLYRYRNERWGQFFPWAPYRVDRFKNHVAHSYKMAVIYHSSIL